MVIAQLRRFEFCPAQMRSEKCARSTPWARSAVGICAVALVATQALAQPAPELTRIVASLEGEWSNATQYRNAPASLKVPPSVAGEWLDWQYAVFRKIDAPLIGTHVLYLEWRSGGPQGALSRQRIWSFRTDDAGKTRMDFYAFQDGLRWVALPPADYRALSPSALRGYGPQCALYVTASAAGLDGRITAAECTLTAASGRSMGIDATFSVANNLLRYQESGRLATGDYAFRVPPTMPYAFEKVDVR
jgi:hypothetical protein